jgi:hypothetical protein
MSDWTWEYVPDAANIVGGLTRPRLTRWKASRPGSPTL